MKLERCSLFFTQKPNYHTPQSMKMETLCNCHPRYYHQCPFKEVTYMWQQFLKQQYPQTPSKANKQLQGFTGCCPLGWEQPRLFIVFQNFSVRKESQGKAWRLKGHILSGPTVKNKVFISFLEPSLAKSLQPSEGIGRGEASPPWSSPKGTERCRKDSPSPGSSTALAFHPQTPLLKHAEHRNPSESVPPTSWFFLRAVLRTWQK